MKRVINIPSKLEHISLIEKTIDEITENLILSPDVYGKVLIASIEGVNNAIVHANKQDENKSVIVELFADKSKITITIKDQGPGFDPNCIPDPTKPENLENISGRGVFLMKKLSDKIEFENNGSTVIMHFNIV
jgi:serine/threonine-protein kinase RsbW